MPWPLTVLTLSDSSWWTPDVEGQVALARGLAARGHRVVIGCVPGSPIATRAREAGLEAREVDGIDVRVSPLTGFRAARRLAAVLRELDPDLVHAWRTAPHLVATVALRGLKAIRLVRSRASAEAPASNAVNRMLYDRATDLTIVGGRTARERAGDAGFDVRRFAVLDASLSGNSRIDALEAIYRDLVARRVTGILSAG